MELGNITQHKGVPVLEVRVGNVMGYLSPFRGNKFQVSGVIEGHNDYGSSTMTDLKDANLEILYDLAELALLKYQVYLKYTRITDLYINPILDIRDHFKLTDFIRLCKEWLTRLEK